MKTLVHFTKMHGLGNDFIILDTISQSIKIDSHLIRKIANRNFGIGCDQVLIVEPPMDPDFDFNYRVFNANGKEVAQCGNGARCLGRYVYERGLIHKKQIQLGTLSGKLLIDVSDLSRIQVNMGVPQYLAKMIPLNTKETKQISDKGRHKIQILGNEREVTILSLGNPHCIIFVPATSEAAVNEIGNALQEHPAFPKGINVSFLQVLARNHVKCRVFERGVGETLACGSAACAVVIAGINQEELNTEVKVDMLGGSLTVAMQSDNSVLLCGSAISVFNGEFSMTLPDESY